MMMRRKIIYTLKKPLNYSGNLRLTNLSWHLFKMKEILGISMS